MESISLRKLSKPENETLEIIKKIDTLLRQLEDSGEDQWPSLLYELYILEKHYGIPLDHLRALYAWSHHQNRKTFMEQPIVGSANEGSATYQKAMISEAQLWLGRLHEDRITDSEGEMS